MESLEAGKVRVLIVDDQEIMRDALQMLLSTHPGIEVVGAVADGEAAVLFVSDSVPDIVIMDIKMPRVNGIVASQRIREMAPNIRIILLSAYDDTPYVTSFLGDDPRYKSYLLKHSLGRTKDFIRVVLNAAKGQTVLDPAVVKRLTPDRPPPDIASLSEREHEVLSLMADGQSNKAIADHLHLCAQTVDAHITGVYRKLGLSRSSGASPRVRAVLDFLAASNALTEARIRE